MLSVVTVDGSTESGYLIDEIVREGARGMPAAALEAEANQYIAELAAEADAVGRRPVIRNGHHRPRTVVTAAGPVEARAPRVWLEPRSPGCIRPRTTTRPDGSPYAGSQA